MEYQQGENQQVEDCPSRRDAVKALGGLGLAGLLGGLGGCASGLTAADGTSEEGRQQRPNIVFIMADDLGYGDLGSYGQEHIQTPNIDRMAREGMRFTDFYAGSTVCAPSRSVLMTGQHTGHTPVRGNGRASAPIGNVPLPAESTTVAEMLSEAGYATGMFGKWGLGGPESEALPANQGFDEFFGYLDQLRAHYYYPEFLFRGDGERVPLEDNKVKENPPVSGSGQPVQRGTYSHDAITDEALSFIDRHQEKPFFLYVPSTIPHVSLAAPEEAMARYLDEDGNSVFPEEPFPGGHYTGHPMPRAAYAAMVSRLDRAVGCIMEKLQTLGLAEETIVFFTSDNGPSQAGGSDPAFFESNGPLRGGKKNLYEGGIRVPMIAWGPGRVPSGTTTHQVAYLGDVMATLADLTEADLPAQTDSVSFLPAIRGKPRRQRAPLYWEYYNQGTMQAVRDGKWKAVRQPMQTGDLELYDLARDVSEQQDVAAQHPDVVARLEDVMAEEHTPSPIWATE